MPQLGAAASSAINPWLALEDGKGEVLPQVVQHLGLAVGGEESPDRSIQHLQQLLPVLPPADDAQDFQMRDSDAVDHEMRPGGMDAHGRSELGMFAGDARHGAQEVEHRHQTVDVAVGLLG